MWKSLRFDGVDTSFKTNITLQHTNVDDAVQLSMLTTERCAYIASFVVSAD